MSDFFDDVSVNVTELKPEQRVSDGFVTGWKYVLTISKQGHVREYEGLEDITPTKVASDFTLAEINLLVDIEHHKAIFQSQYESTVGVSEADKVFDDSFKVSNLK